MKTSRVVVALASGLFLLGSLGAPASAQQGGRPAGGTRAAGEIALIDIDMIFKNHARFKQLMTDFNADVGRADQQMQEERKAVQGLSEKLNTFHAGSTEYRQLEEEIAKRTADWNVRLQIQKKDFGKAQARIYNMIYQEVQQEIDAYAQANGIMVVMKFSSRQADPEKPEEIMRDLTNPVAWYARNLDITPVILDSLNRRALQTDRRAEPNGPVNLPPRR